MYLICHASGGISQVQIPTVIWPSTLIISLFVVTLLYIRLHLPITNPMVSCSLLMCIIDSARVSLKQCSQLHLDWRLRHKALAAIVMQPTRPHGHGE